MSFIPLVLPSFYSKKLYAFCALARARKQGIGPVSPKTLEECNSQPNSQ